MEKKTILAVVLSSIVLIVSFMIQNYYVMRNQQRALIEREMQESSHVQAAETERVLENTPLSTPETEPSFQTALSAPVQPSSGAGMQTDDTVLPETITVETDLYTAVLTNAGGDMVSFNWKDPRHGTDVDLILSGDNPARAFAIAFGDHNAVPVSDYFHVNRISEYEIEFYRDFLAQPGSNERFRLIKRYDFVPTEYLFRLTVTLDGGFSVQGFNFAGNAYTLSFGPQIGPRFVKLDNIYDYRHLSIFTNGKRKDVKVNEIIDRPVSWASISGKYFAFIARPLAPESKFVFTNKEEPGITPTSRLNLIRPAVNNMFKIVDTYQFYLGPKTLEALSKYNNGDNSFNIREANFSEIASSKGIWGILSPLERLLKWLLMIFYTLVPNYGIAIILLVLLIKILFFPLTKKGSEATLRMQALTPKIKEIQEKYKSDPQKLRMEMGKFYQQEGYNPMSGCLPMLLQLPIFIAMYNLFNNHFDLRGAGFIPGWIPDLSIPEFIVEFKNFKVPIVGWTALRALPFIYVGSQLVYSKVTQMPGQQSNAQMKMMMYILPIVFFFILYDVPSGLLIYWIFSNLLTLVQQLIINRYILIKKAAEAEANANSAQNTPPPKIVPPKKKKKK
ncbi:MAG: membrane protein insertase YidC [Treponema sp.]|nr:membrane protein insertase YidC [Treponema sp.]MCL2237081.1 membrane protein insertase YidC [Treponema sp.]